MYDYGWSRFTQTGQIYDYLEYKGIHTMKKEKNKAGEVQECSYAGLRISNRNHNQSRADRGI